MHRLELKWGSGVHGQRWRWVPCYVYYSPNSQLVSKYKRSLEENQVAKAGT